MKKLLFAAVLSLISIAQPALALNIPVATFAFTPRRITSLFAWYDAADTQTLTVGSGVVSQWNDKSGNGYNATATSTAQPSTGNLINGRNGLLFDGSANTMTLPSGTYSLSNNSTVTMFVVEKPSSSPPAQGRMYNAQDAGGNRFYTYLATTDILASIQGTVGVQSSSVTFDTNTHVYIYQRNGANQTISRDGNSFLTTNAGATAAFTSTEFNLGSQHGGNLMKGTAGEYAFYNKSLSTYELNRVGVNLCNKWGCTWTNF